MRGVCRGTGVATIASRRISANATSRMATRRSRQDCEHTRASASKAMSRMLGPITVGLAMMSAIVTFVGTRRPDADRADPRRRRHAAAGQRGHRRCCCSASSAGRSGRIVRRGAAAARARRLHVRIVGAVFGHRGGAGHPGGGGREHHARSRARPPVLHPHPSGDPELADRRASLSARARPDRSRRHSWRWRSIGRAKPMFDEDRERFRQFLTSRPRVRGLARSSCSTAI